MDSDDQCSARLLETGDNLDAANRRQGDGRCQASSPHSQPSESGARLTCHTASLLAAGACCLLLALCLFLPPIQRSGIFEGASQLLGRESGKQHSLPFCRKSSSAVVLPLACPAAFPDASRSNGTSSACSRNSTIEQQLVVWSGIGVHKHIFGDLFAFDLSTSSWLRLDQPLSPRPVPRWKAGGAVAAAGGMLVVAGDAYFPGTRRHFYSSEVWRLHPANWSWEQGVVAPGSPQPAPRRGHSLVLYLDANGTEHLALFGGRTQAKVLLNDVWDATLSWPRVSWRQLAPLTLSSAAGSFAPAPRRGHSAVFVPGGGDAPQMLVYGGREELHYFGDSWLFDLAHMSWQQVEPAAGDDVPPGRDHHAVAYVGAKMYVWGGRSGPNYCESRPMDELWAFTLAARTWQRVEQAGDVPLPRFEHAYTQYQPAGEHDAPRLLIFGGQTADVCQLNDVQELDLGNLTWRQLRAPSFCTEACQQAFGDGDTSIASRRGA